MSSATVNLLLDRLNERTEMLPTSAGCRGGDREFDVVALAEW